MRLTFCMPRCCGYPEASRRCGSVLSDTELQRADRFVTEDGKAHFKQRRAFRRYCEASRSDHRGPYLGLIFEACHRSSV